MHQPFVKFCKTYILVSSRIYMAVVFFIGSSDVGVTLCSFSGVPVAYVESSFVMSHRVVGIWIDLSRMLATFLDNYGILL